MRFQSSHVLDFTSDVVMPALKASLSLMVGAGDLNHNDMPNVQQFSHDVFFCNAWDMHGSFQTNIDWIEKNESTKIICVVDYYDEDQRNKFIELFKGRFHLIDGHGGHVPHFTILELERLLAEGGEAVNIHEKSESMMPIDDAKYYFENGYFPGFAPSPAYLTSRIYIPSRSMSQEEVRELERLFIAKINHLEKSLTQITIQTDILENLSLLSLADLQQILACLQYEKQMPINMNGHICMNMRIWQDLTRLEIVIKKVPVDFFDAEINDKDFDTAKKARADYIIEAIRQDMENGNILGQFAKYRTLKKLLDKI